VLIAKTKHADLAPFIWVIDAHPDDINLVDYLKPNGEDFMVSKGDYRQLADATFHAGTGPGVVSEFVDQANRLHFYVLDIARDTEGVLSYRVAVRSLDGGGPYDHDVSVTEGTHEPASPGRVAVYRFRVFNDSFLAGVIAGTDLIRLQATTEAGWGTTLTHSVIDVESASPETVDIYITLPDVEEGETLPPTSLTFTATSETDPTKTATLTVPVEPAQ
jgi:hypothetical protein